MIGAGPLAGLRVLEISTMMAGPYAATLLGDLGADVIKVEPPRGDESRHLGPARGAERSAFLSLNRSKRGMVLDLQRPEGREAFGRLVATADIVITNVREPTLSAMGLDYDSVRTHRPDIIWVGITAFGVDGPYAGRPGIDFLIQGYGGLLALTGEPGAPPVRVTVPLIDTLTSVLVTTAALTAVHTRAADGQGQRIDISLLDALIHAQAAGLGSYLVTGEETPRTGNRSLYFAPSGIYGTRDGHQVVITCPSERFFTKLCQALDADWDTDPRFVDIPARMAHQDELDEVMDARCRAFDRDELVARLVAADVLTAPINGVAQVVADAQVSHNDMIVTTDHATLGAVQVTGVPIHFGGTPAQVRSAPPTLGQHTAEVLAELGYDTEAIEAICGTDALWGTESRSETRPAGDSPPS